MFMLGSTWWKSLPALLVLAGGLASEVELDAAALYNITDLSARKNIRLNDRGQMAYEVDVHDSYHVQGKDFRVYDSLSPSGEDRRIALPQGDGYFYDSVFVGQDQALYGSRTAAKTEGFRLGAGGEVIPFANPSFGDQTNSAIREVNADGVVRGDYWKAGGPTLAFTYNQSTGDFKSPEMAGSQQILGKSLDSSGRYLADVYVADGSEYPGYHREERLVNSDSTHLELPAPEGASGQYVTAMNDHGQHVGTAFYEGQEGRPYVWSDGAFQELAMPGRPDLEILYPTQINNAGQMIVQTTSGDYLVDGDEWRSLNELYDDPENRFELYRALVLNDLGQIIVEGMIEWGEGRNLHSSSFLLTPRNLPVPVQPMGVPEPTTLAVIGVGVVVLGFRRYWVRGV